MAAFEETDNSWPDVSAEEDDEEQPHGDYDGPYLQAVLSDLVRDVDAGDASGRIYNWSTLYSNTFNIYLSYTRNLLI